MSDETGKKSWTVMVYLAGDNNLDINGVEDLKEMKQVGSSDAVNVIAQFDRAGKKRHTLRYYLKQGGKLQQDVVADLGETNTGDPQVLEDFIRWGMTEYPAEQYLVVLWNHGAGWDDTNVYRAARAENLNITYKAAVIKAEVETPAGDIASRNLRQLARRPIRRALFNTTIRNAFTDRAIAFDDQAGDFIDSVEMKKVLESVTAGCGCVIDVLGMDACLMNMLEVAYQVKGSAKYCVGSEELEPMDGWPYDTILAELVAKPNMGARELSALIVDKYLASYPPEETVTQSAISNAQMESIASAVSKLAQKLTRKLSNTAIRKAIRRARQQVQSYGTVDYVDLIHLCKLLQAETSHALIQSLCQNVLDNANSEGCVIANGCIGDGVKNSHGISIYFPESHISPLYKKLDFAADTAWDDFLQAYLV